MWISLTLGLMEKILGTIIDEQCHNNPQALKKEVELLVSAICKPSRMKGGT